ncbi:glycoside hydrolase family 17 protein [Plenodomus tracheiphilus IPT5]|uniref:Probable beta-glucosidase btgE n=1 Tax=Plenodomus tracheiphilus IPT5 TaxID=1408161 RepID=A0A6A7B669_9PLEO|nr:glycoside hydrolase family 17 protein [Plenodomus tracheiphilus IPT5]
MKYSFVAAALVGSVLATQHHAHGGFHARRHEAKEEVCTVYTTVYATAPAPLPTIVANSTMAYPAGGPSVSTSCTEEVKTPIYTPVVLSSTHGAPVPSKEAHPPAPVPSKDVPVPSKEASPPAPVPASSTSCTDEKETHAPTPAVPAVPVVSKEAYPPVPASSTSCTDEKETHAPTPAVPAVPVVSKEAHPPAPVPASSTSCTDEKETHAPTPAVPAVPKETHAPTPAVPAVPVVSKEAYPPAPISSQVAYPPAPKPEAPKPAPVSSASAYPSKPAEQPKPVPASSKAVDKPKPTGGYSSGGRITTNGDKWAITYTPYANSGDCKSYDEIKADIKKIADLGFTTIRSYSTDCGVFEFVVPECQKHGLKVIYGIFLEGAGKGPFSEYANAQLNDIKEKAPKDSVAMVIVGNECIFNNNCKPDQLASYIDHVRDELRSCGFPTDIAVTTTEPVGTWEQKGAALCDHIDVFTVQVHPYFTDSITADQAGNFAAEQLKQAAKVCPGAAAKGMYITEIGWPSAGETNGLAIAGFAEQKIAMKTIMEKVGSQACLFSYQNDGWKAAGTFGVEQNFGCIEALY